MSGAFDKLENWARRAMRFVDRCDADAAGYDELHEDAESLTLSGYRVFGLEPFADVTSIAKLETTPLASIEIARELLNALERAEKHVETLHSLLLPAGRQSEAVKILWRDLRLFRDTIAKARAL